MTRKFSEHVGLNREIGPRCLAPRLDGEPSTVGEIDSESRKSEADGQMRQRGDACAECGFEPRFDVAVADHESVNGAAIVVTTLIQNHLNSAFIDMRTKAHDVQRSGTKRYRALFVSDIHLGTKACQAEAFLDFLRSSETDRIYLVGDIVDFWRIKRGVYWPQAHNDVLQKLLRWVRKGGNLVFIPGNHDEAMRDYCGARFGGISIERSVIHTGADGRRYLVMHGDEFDVVVRYAKWLALFGDWSYTVALWANTHFNAVRRWFGMPYWSLSAYLKHKVKRAVNYIGEFESALAAEARRHGAQGVICGHIHHAAIRQVGDVLYINTGDWVESCTAVAETEEGIFELIRWTPHPYGMSRVEGPVEELEAAA
jgi:UDP-2,3-diacylglucosamine pyrophosphatase LpxH